MESSRSGGVEPDPKAGVSYMILPTSLSLLDQSTSMSGLFPLGLRQSTDARSQAPFTGVGLQTGGEPPRGVLDGVGVQIWVFWR